MQMNLASEHTYLFLNPSANLHEEDIIVLVSETAKKLALK